MAQKIHIIEQGKPEIVLLQMTFAEELPTLQAKVNAIYQATKKPFVLAAVEVNNWSHDLSPWKSPSISPREQLGDGATDTLRALETEMLPMLSERYGELLVIWVATRWQDCSHYGQARRPIRLLLLPLALRRYGLTAGQNMLMHIRCWLRPFI